MAAEQRELSTSFVYEPGFTPRIPPGQTITEWRRPQVPPRRRRGLRRALGRP